MHLPSDNPIEAVFEVGQHEFKCFGPLRIAVELKPNCQICDLVLFNCIGNLKGVVLRDDPV